MPKRAGTFEMTLQQAATNLCKKRSVLNCIYNSILAYYVILFKECVHSCLFLNAIK